MDIKLPNIKDLGDKFVKNLNWLFFAIFLFLLVLEAFEINSSAKIILDFNNRPEAAITDKGVRINFDNYDQIAKRIQQSDSFQPTGGITKNPFGIAAPPK